MKLSEFLPLKNTIETTCNGPGSHLRSVHLERCRLVPVYLSRSYSPRTAHGTIPSTAWSSTQSHLSTPSDVSLTSNNQSIDWFSPSVRDVHCCVSQRRIRCFGCQHYFASGVCVLEWIIGGLEKIRTRASPFRIEQRRRAVKRCEILDLQVTPRERAVWRVWRRLISWCHVSMIPALDAGESVRRCHPFAECLLRWC